MRRIVGRGYEWIRFREKLGCKVSLPVFNLLEPIIPKTWDRVAGSFATLGGQMGKLKGLSGD